MRKTILREFHNSDVETIFEWKNNSNFNRCMFFQPDISKDEYFNWVSSLNPEDSKCLMIETDGSIVGIAHLYDLNKSKYRAMLEFYTIESIEDDIKQSIEEALLSFSFNNLNLFKLSSEVLSDNLSVINLHRRFGFSIEGIFKNHFEIAPNKTSGVYRLAISKQEWEKSLINETKLNIGQFFSHCVEISSDLIKHFGEATGDMNPIHFDDKAAQQYGFDTRISHGILPLGLISKILGMDFPGKGTIYTDQSIKFLRPILNGTEVKINLEVLTILKRKVILSTTVTDNDGNTYLSGEATVLAPKN